MSDAAHPAETARTPARRRPTLFSGLREFARLVTAPSGPRGIAAVPSVADMRERARRKVPRMIFDFVDGGANREDTLRANVDDLSRVTFVPRALVDVRERDTTTVIAGSERPLPLVLGPAGLVRLVGREGELAAVRAAGARGVPYTISTSSAWSIEEIAEVATGPLWFQLYLWRSERVVRELVVRAREAGCEALVLTVDVPLNANRIRDLRNGMSIPPRLTLRNAVEAARRPRWMLDMVTGPPVGFRNFSELAGSDGVMSHSAYINTHLSNLAATWDDLATLRREWEGPILVKGVMSAGDARRALDAGADGVIVSNHGGRQLDGLPSSASVLPRIVDAVGDRGEVLLDGGIRSGVDVAKALALGASAVTVARSWVFGVAAGGEAGVARVLDLYEEELRQTLALLGANRAGELGRDFAEFPAEWAASPESSSTSPVLTGEARAARPESPEKRPARRRAQAG